jgi:MFS family permease
MTASPAGRGAAVVPGLATVVGLLVVVELTSGVLQGYYTPVYTDIGAALRVADGDLNWFEAAQLIFSALLVPLLARLGDVIGHRNVLLLSTAVTAAGSWVMAFAPGFTTFLVGSALQGAYVVWLPLEVAIIYRRTAGSGQQDRLTRRSAAWLVAALEAGVIVGALTSGALVEATSMRVLLALPAVVVTACLAVIWFGIEAAPGEATGGVDLRGLALVTVVLGLVMAGLVVVRLQGVGSLLAWSLLLLGLLAVLPLVRVERGLDEPLIDVRLLAHRDQWPIQLTAFLFGMSVLGAQIPLSTFARADPAVVGYGLGAEASFVSTLLGLYVVCILLGALLLPWSSRLLGARGAMAAGCGLVSLGYALWLPFHHSAAQGVANLAVVGLGSGILVAALPAAAAAAAPADRTGFATGMTNATKTVGGAIASAVFAIALASTGSLDDPAAGAASLSGYLTVWAVCSFSAALAAVALLTTARRRTPQPAGSLRPGPVG